MKRILFAFTMFVLVTTSMAQGNKGKGPKTPEQKATNVSNKMSQELSLAEDQKSKIYAMSLERLKKKEQLKVKYANDKEAAKKEYKEIQQSYATNLKTLLTPEQYKRWEEIKAQKKAKKEKEDKDEDEDNDKEEVEKEDNKDDKKEKKKEFKDKKEKGSKDDE